MYIERKIINYFMRISTNRNHLMHADLAIDDGRADENIDDYNLARKPFIERAMNILNSYIIDNNCLTPETQMISPPWALHSISVSRDLYHFKK